MQHQPSWVDYPRRRPRHMASHYKQSCLLLRILPEVCHRGKTSEEEKQCSHNTKPWRDLYLLSLQLNLSIPHRPDKSQACLQETWTSSTWSSLAKQSHDQGVKKATSMILFIIRVFLNCALYMWLICEASLHLLSQSKGQEVADEIQCIFLHISFFFLLTNNCTCDVLTKKRASKCGTHVVQSWCQQTGIPLANVLK